MRLISSDHSVHKLGYHIVWCTKYRNKVLVGAVEVETKNIIAEACVHYEWQLESLEVMPDHVHLMVQLDPSTAPNEVPKALKSISAVRIFTLFPNLKKQRFWGSGLWSRSTFFGSIGNDEDIVKNYIANQK